MSLGLSFLRRNVIFLFIGNRELTFIRFVKGKIFSSRSYKVSYDIEQNEIKAFFKDYFTGKEGIPICIIHDVPNQVFTEYTFVKSISKKVIHNSIIKKITNEIAQEAIHSYFKINIDEKKSSECVYQVLSLIKTPIVSFCLDLLHKFPNPIAGHFSMILEMPLVCEGNTHRVKLPKAIPVIEQDEFDLKEKGVDDLTVAIQHSPISGINFILYQGKRVLFHHSVVCKKIDEEIQKEVQSTVITILDYCKQSNADYQVYIYGSDILLKSILDTSFDVKCLYYTQADVADSKFFYHKEYHTNPSKTGTLDAIAFKALYEPTFFVANKVFYLSIIKHLFLKAGFGCIAIFVVAFFVYQLCISSLSVFNFFVKYNNKDSLNISNVLNKVQLLEKDVNEKKDTVNFYSSFQNNAYQKFMQDFAPLIRGTSHVESLLFVCKEECNNYNAKFEVIVNGHVDELQDYYALTSDIRRIFFRHEITRKIDESAGNFSLQIVTLNK